METTTVVETTRTKVFIWAAILFILGMVLMWIVNAMITDHWIQDNIQIITVAKKNITLNNLKIADLQKNTATQSWKIAEAAKVLKTQYNIIYK